MKDELFIPYPPDLPKDQRKAFLVGFRKAQMIMEESIDAEIADMNAQGSVFEEMTDRIKSRMNLS